MRVLSGGETPLNFRGLHIFKCAGALFPLGGIEEVLSGGLVALVGVTFSPSLVQHCHPLLDGRRERGDLLKQSACLIRLRNIAMERVDAKAVEF